jgi:hypothetical protein
VVSAADPLRSLISVFLTGYANQTHRLRKMFLKTTRPRGILMNFLSFDIGTHLKSSHSFGTSSFGLQTSAHSTRNVQYNRRNSVVVDRAVSCQFPTVVAGLRPQVRSLNICGQEKRHGAILILPPAAHLRAPRINTKIHVKTP